MTVPAPAQPMQDQPLKYLAVNTQSNADYDGRPEGAIVAITSRLLLRLIQASESAKRMARSGQTVLGIEVAQDGISPILLILGCGCLDDDAAEYAGLLPETRPLTDIQSGQLYDGALLMDTEPEDDRRLYFRYSKGQSALRVEEGVVKVVFWESGESVDDKFVSGPLDIPSLLAAAPQPPMPVRAGYCYYALPFGGTLQGAPTLDWTPEAAAAPVLLALAQHGGASDEVVSVDVYELPAPREGMALKLNEAVQVATYHTVRAQAAQGLLLRFSPGDLL